MRKANRLFRLIGFTGAVVPLLILWGCGRAKVEPVRPAPLPPLLAGKDLGAITSDLQVLIPSLMTKARIPGLQIALIRDGRIAWRQGFGVRDTKTGAAVTDETIFEAASLTKPLFAYYVLKLVDQGVLSLDRPLAGYLPPEEIVKILGHALEEKGFHREWFEKITARHVLSHSSGFPHGETGRPYPLAFEPGTKWKYSADGYFYLQRVVEYVKGDALDRLMQKEILDPLGMTRSCMVWKLAYEDTMASGHGLLGRPEAFRKRTKAHAGATLYTTAEDYAMFVCAVLNGQGLRPETRREMTTPQIDMDKPKGLGWALGFGTQSDANGQALWQWGDYGTFRNYTIAYPEGRSGVVYLANSFHGLGICSDLVGHSLGGQALGSVALNYRPYDCPIYRFVWDVEERGPRAVKELKRLKREYPGMFDRSWIGYLAESFQEAGMIPHARALLEYDLQEHPRSGKAALALAEAYLKAGDRVQARRNFELALQATEEPVDKTAVRQRLQYIAALDKPDRTDLSGEWSGTLWTGDGQADTVTMVLKSRGADYEGTLGDTLGLIPAGTQTQSAVRTGEEFAFTVKIPLEGGTLIRVTLSIQGGAMKGRWLDVRGGNGGPVEVARAIR